MSDYQKIEKMLADSPAFERVNLDKETAEEVTRLEDTARYSLEIGGVDSIGEIYHLFYQMYMGAMAEMIMAPISRVTDDMRIRFGACQILEERWRKIAIHSKGNLPDITCCCGAYDKTGKKTGFDCVCQS